MERQQEKNDRLKRKETGKHAAMWEKIEEAVKNGREEITRAACRGLLAATQELQTYHTELEFQNEALREAETAADDMRRKYQDLFDNAPVGYLTLDQKGVILESNLTIAALLGEKKAKLTGKPLSRYLINQEDADELYKRMQNLFSKGERFSSITTINGKDGTSVRVQLVFTLVSDAGGAPVLCRATVTNISEQEAL